MTADKYSLRAESTGVRMAIIACTRCIYEVECMGTLETTPSPKCIIGSLDLSREEKQKLLARWFKVTLPEEEQKKCEEEKARRERNEIKFWRGG